MLTATIPTAMVGLDPAFRSSSWPDLARPPAALVHPRNEVAYGRRKAGSDAKLTARAVP